MVMTGERKNHQRLSRKKMPSLVLEVLRPDYKTKIYAYRTRTEMCCGTILVNLRNTVMTGAPKNLSVLLI